MASGKLPTPVEKSVNKDRFYPPLLTFAERQKNKHGKHVEKCAKVKSYPTMKGCYAP